MSKVSIAIPCYNEESNIPQLHRELTKLMRNELPEYDYEILFVDNKSKDRSRELIRDICVKDKHVKAIFNRINCGPNTNPFFAIRESDADCTVLLYADFQEPIEMIPVMVRKWEEGNKVICMIKTHSRENRIVYFAREIYYRIFKRMSSIEQIKQFTGYGLYDRSFIEVIRQIQDPVPFIKGIVAEFAPERLEIPYEQQRRKGGHSSLNFMGYYDSAMLSFTSYTKSGLRLATFGGLAIAIISFIVAVVYLIMKLMYWDRFAAGGAPVLLSVLFLGGIQLLFLGLLGEYVMNINTRVINRPMVIEEERINFSKKEDNIDES
ncbi:MAG: glycosyltransferase family 2 protein [Roseburia sp.]|nr:glycosyltransferase family 2 protein [Roseburia sp.]